MKHTTIIYIGPAPAVEARYGAGFVHFEKNAETACPADLAESLLQQDTFTTPKNTKEAE